MYKTTFPRDPSSELCLERDNENFEKVVRERGHDATGIAFIVNLETTIRGCSRAHLRLGDSKARRSPKKWIRKPQEKPETKFS